MSPHGLRFDGGRFWVCHRRREYGPFDYEWSRDLGGVELTFRGEKFGEFCSPEEIYADLKGFHLPRTVAEVGSIVAGCIVFGVLNGLDEAERRRMIFEQLAAGGHPRFGESLRDDARE